MSQQYPQDPNFQPPGPTAPQPQKPNHTALIIGLVVGGSLLFGAGVAVGAARGDPTTKSAVTSSATKTTTAPATTEPAPVETTTEAPPVPTYAAPAAKHFKLTAKILSKQCFGSAGCNVTYRILVTYTGPTLDPAVTYDVLYSVTGGEDGPVSNTLKVTGDESSVDEEESLSTKNKTAKLTVVVSDILG
ncbi:hypothetical protein [Kribbella sp. NPDC023855]|uniref:hypothetical protein n=1 Tax=Kribbella sp. NPDC023855 TaxID=3154698 RepID=UPI0033C69048